MALGVGNAPFLVIPAEPRRNGGGPVMALGVAVGVSGSCAEMRRNGGGPVMALGAGGVRGWVGGLDLAAMEEGR